MHNINILEEKDYSLKLSAAVLVEHVTVTEFYGRTEFSVEGLVQATDHELLPLQIRYSARDPEHIDELRTALRPGNLLLVRAAEVVIVGRTMRLISPPFTLLEDDSEAVRKEFERHKTALAHPYDPRKGMPEGKIRGLAIECRLCSTKEFGVMAFITVDTEEGYYEAVLFQEVLQRHLTEISELGFMEFFGKFEPNEDPEEIPKMLVDRIFKI